MPIPRTWRPLLAAVLVAGSILGLLLGWLWAHRSGVVVVVVNEDDRTIRSVEVGTTAGVYVLGDLAPSQSAQVIVGARGESTVWVGWTDAAGTARWQDVGPYFEGSAQGSGDYSGEVSVALRDGGATASDDVRLGVPVFTRGRAATPDRTGTERYPR